MGKSKYTRLYIFYVNKCRKSAQTILVKETEKLWQDVTSSLYWEFPDRFPDIGFKVFYWGHLKKEMAYEPIFSNYSFMMYGPDLDKLKKAWESSTGFNSEPLVGYNEEELTNFINLLNNGEISLKKRR